MTVQINITFNPFSYEVLIGSGQEYLQTTQESVPASELPSQSPEIEKKDDEAIAKAQLEKFNQGDIASQNIASALVKEKEVIVIKDDKPADQEVNALLKQYSDEIISALPSAVTQLQEAVREGIFEVMAESINTAESLLDEEKKALFGPLEQHVNTAYGSTNDAIPVMAIKQQVLEKIESYVAAVNEAKNKPVEPPVVEIEKVDYAARAEELIKGINILSPEDKGQLWTLLVLDEEGRAAELKALERPCPQVTADILEFINGLDAEKRAPFIETFTNAAVGQQ
ncbi:MAG: hypothetical protein JSR46_07155 [Verrucomicrobia bacterium]|nr:hypothetical protein [Verrucomicrobiota bacterium]